MADAGVFCVLGRIGDECLSSFGSSSAWLIGEMACYAPLDP